MDDLGEYHTCATRLDRTLWCWGDASHRPPKYERPPVATSFTPFEPVVRQLLKSTPDSAGDGGRRAGRLDRFDQLVPATTSAGCVLSIGLSILRTG